MIKNIMSNDIIPENQSGLETNTESSVTLNSIEEARSFYEIAKQRLLDVNNWHAVSGALTADFQLTDASGNEVNRSARKKRPF